MDTKICRVCQVPKPLDCFRVRLGRVLGECRSCAAEQSRAYYAANSDKCRAASIKWYREHPEQRAASSRAWANKNPGRRAALKRAWDKKNPEKRAVDKLAWDKKNLSKRKWYALQRAYGISGKEFEARVAAQGGVCAICGGPPTTKRKHLSVDHCHETGQIRGLLCGPCNTGIGQLRDSPVLLQKALDYLKNFVPTQKP